MLEHEIASLKDDNTVLIETQVRLESALSVGGGDDEVLSAHILIRC